MMLKSNKKQYVTDKRTIGEIYGIKQPLFFPPNKRYQNIKNIVYTGPTKKNAIKLSNSMIYKQRSENFHRIKSSILIKLLLASETKKIEEDNEDDSYEYNQPKKIINLEEILSQEKKNISSDELADIKFVLLDFREEKEYHKCHIKNSLSYPSNLISQDRFLREMYMMKNKDNKIIIVYHKDEKSGIPVSNLLTLKGFENLYMLSGGFFEFSKLYPEYLIGAEKEIYIKEKEKRIKEREIILEKRNKNRNKNKFKPTDQSIEESNENENNESGFNSNELIKNKSYDNSINLRNKSPEKKK